MFVCIRLRINGFLHDVIVIVSSLLSFCLPSGQNRQKNSLKECVYSLLQTAFLAILPDGLLAHGQTLNIATHLCFQYSYKPCYFAVKTRIYVIKKPIKLDF